ncbi:unnamed protein product [Caenorhabditis nigoni]
MSKFRRILTYILDLGVNPKRHPLDEEDLKLAAYLIDLGESIDKGVFDVEMEQHLSNFEDDLQDLSEFKSIYVGCGWIRCATPSKFRNPSTTPVSTRCRWRLYNEWLFQHVFCEVPLL